MSAEPEDASSTFQPLDEWFLDLLACPACVQRLPLHLGEGSATLICQCGRYAYPVREGLPILLVEEAILLNENAYPEDMVRDDKEDTVKQDIMKEDIVI